MIYNQKFIYIGKVLNNMLMKAQFQQFIFIFWDTVDSLSKNFSDNLFENNFSS